MERLLYDLVVCLGVWSSLDISPRGTEKSQRLNKSVFYLPVSSKLVFLRTARRYIRSCL